MSATTSAVPSSTASAARWRDSLLDVDRLVVDDALVARIDALPQRLRSRVITRLNHAVRLGVCDRLTLTTILEAVTASDR